ncbi:Protoporphyrinogen oxidase [Cyphellophora attinorum]|uniref:Protoporphyrinogen oxidase n=1 Tax=Cyphellophora attinorum TaxID=1664694 RepID=A0A0N1HAS2_9EURO|nr:Protoporphyrinogen oxidase [Phialophora attinorum]KPI39917.1 Protoporphyrinogen oxidase [Phialophora attinorum]
MLLAAGRLTRRHVTSQQPLLQVGYVLVRPFTEYSSFPADHRRAAEELVNYKPIAANPQAKKIAVLGGGITGLAAAYELARTIPHASITVYEKSERLGGWLNSEVVPVKGGEIIFEWGARSFRTPRGDGLATTMLLRHLLEEAESSDRRPTIRNHIIAYPPGSGAANDRWIYYPDHLVRLPGPKDGFKLPALWNNIRSFITEPIWRGVFMGMLSEPTKPGRDPELKDESVGEFLTRRFGSAVADNFASAVIHGIYAGDIYKLSVHTAMPLLSHLERHSKEHTVLGELFFNKGGAWKPWHDFVLRELIARKSGHKSANYLEPGGFSTFTDGMSGWTRLLKYPLLNAKRVTIQKSSPVTSLSYKDSKVLVTDASGSAKTFDYAISTLPAKTMRTLVSGSRTFDPIAPATTVMVVNLFYPEGSLTTAVGADGLSGFGYLIPRSVPVEQNPERALGVIFAHNSSGDTGPESVEGLGRRDSWQSPEGCQEVIETLTADQTEMTSKQSEGTQHASLVNLRQLSAYRRRLDQFNAGKVRPDEKIIDRSGQDTVKGAKLTVMLGGHWWDGWSEQDYPSEEEGIQMAKSVLRRHLDIHDNPEVAKAKLQRDCIPQYPVGYRDYMAKVHEEIHSKFEDRLKLAGPFYQGAVGVNDCIKQATWAAMAIRDNRDPTAISRYAEKLEGWVHPGPDAQFPGDSARQT